MTDSILIVDDSTFIVDGLVALLKKSYTPIPSFGGEECLEILRTVTPSLIILDIMMEPMDGWETLARIKNNPKTRRIPVLMFSAKKISPEEAEAHRIIIDDFLTKPVNPKKLIEAIEKVLARQESNKRIIGSWEAAGVSREIIDEYLAIKTNLDVDVSLLAVMNKQLEMAHPDAENRGELERSVAALTSRIAESRASIDSFCHEQSGVLPLQDPAGSTVPPAAAMPKTEDDISQKTASLEEPSKVPGAPQELPVPAPEHPPPVPPRPEVAERIQEPVEVPLTESTAPFIPPPVSPPVSPQTIGLSPKVEKPEPGMDPAPAPDATGEDKPAESPIVWPKVPPTTSSSPGPVTAGGRPDAGSLFDPFEKPAPEASPVPPMVPEQQAVATEPRSGAGISPPSPALPGAGTKTPSMQSPATTRRQVPEPVAESPSRDHPPAPAGGFFSRLIAAIAALFSKKRL